MARILAAVHLALRCAIACLLVGCDGINPRRFDAAVPDAPSAMDAQGADAPMVDGGPDAPLLDGGPEIGEGTWESPFVATPPTVLSGDTTSSFTDVAEFYSCAPSTPESGREVLYTLTPAVDGTLSLTLDDVPGDGVDLDVHLLSAPSPDACVARADVALSTHVTAGVPIWIAVDSWFDGESALEGAYELTVALREDSTSCPIDMLAVGTICMDRYEAPNRQGALPLVMYTFDEAEAWCAARGKRLCFDDEWTSACTGADGTLYPYGNARIPGTCNDEETWRLYDQTLLNGWRASASATDVTSLADLLARARAVSTTAAAAADHVEALYQGEGGGTNASCTNELGVLDLTGNVEEWTRRRAPGGIGFHGNLKGRYWAETRTCVNDITTHGDGFRFYEIGFRCCSDQ